MRRFASYATLLTALILTSFLTNSDPVDELYKKAEAVSHKYPREKVYMQLDKPCYSIGDSIWFKVYVVNAEKNFPSAISNVLYVNLVDQMDSVRALFVLPLSDGIAAGYIPVADSLDEGNYRIRAYTRWMRNFGEDYFFEQHIDIGDALTNDIILRPTIITANERTSVKTKVLLQYHYLNGHSASGKEISFAFFADAKEVLKGSGSTDSTGSLLIDLNKLKQDIKETCKLITQIKTSSKKNITKSVYLNWQAGESQVSFFPEGGEMVNGIPATIGFKAVNRQGQGIHVTGKIADKDGQIITSFESGFAGIGRCQLLPDSENDYFAIVHFDDGSEKKIPLPKTSPGGYMLSIQSADTDKLHIRIAGNNIDVGDVTLVAQTNNRIEYIAKNNLGSTGIYTVLSKKRFPTGIVQFTLFNAAMQPVAERLVFVNNHDQLGVSISSDKPIYKRGEQVALSLDVKDPEGEIIKGSFSMAVTDASMVSFNDLYQPSILSTLLLSADIKGTIENSGYYFTEDSKKTRTDLDNLLLTQGWRKFTWKDILADKLPPVTFSMEKSLSISGAVKSATGKPLAQRRVTLMFKKGSDLVVDTITDDQGKFIFDRLSFTGDVDFSVQSFDAKGNNDVTVTIDNVPAQAVIKKTGINGTAFLHMDQPALHVYLNSANQRFNTMRKYGQLGEQGKTLKEVFVDAKKNSRLAEALAPSANLNGPGKADQVLTYEDLRNCSDLGMCLQGKLTGVIFKYIYDSANHRRDIIPFSTRGFDRPMLILFDGMEMNTKMGGLTLSTISPSNIQSIEVLRSGPYLASYGTQAAGGVIIITSKRGGIDYDMATTEDKKEKLKGIVFSNARGYAQMREFYSPVYDVKTDKHIPDLRSTIFWAPNLVLDDDGKAAARFYTADVPGTYRVIAEGISDNGKIGRQLFTFNVQ